MTSLKAPLSAQDLLLALQAYPECGTAFDLAANPLLKTIAPVETAESGSLTFLEAGKSLVLLENTQASAILLPPDPQLQQLASDRSIAWIASVQPKLLFARSVPLFYNPIS